MSASTTSAGIVDFNEESALRLVLATVENAPSDRNRR